MKTERIKRRVGYFAGALVLMLILYSCLQDELDLDFQKKATGYIFSRKCNKELTIEAARVWYESRQAPIVSTRSGGGSDFELVTKLQWRYSLESRKGKFEVVEVPLLTRANAVLMDEETMNRYQEDERRKIRNISRMVIIKNLETGEVVNFIMHIVGTYDYLMKADDFEQNSYLYRTPDLDGSVYFYEPEGLLVNGWRYEKGKIVAALSLGTEEGARIQEEVKTRGWETQITCHTEFVYVAYNDCNGFTYEDPEYGLSFGVECSQMGKWVPVERCQEYSVYVEEPWYPGPGEGGGNSGGGGGNGGYIPSPVVPSLNAGLRKIIRKNENLSQEQLDRLSEILNQISENCGDNAVYSYLINNEYTFNSVLVNNSSVSATAGYQPGKGNLVFYGDDSFQYSSFVHEMFHLFQHKFRGEYRNELRGFMEFERNLYMDIIFFVKELKGDWGDFDTLGERTEGWIYLGASGTEQNDITTQYKEWLKRITDEGKQIPTSISEEDFFKFAQFYGEVNRAYNVDRGYKYDKEVGYTPSALLTVLAIARQNCN